MEENFFNPKKLCVGIRPYRFKSKAMENEKMARKLRLMFKKHITNNLKEFLEKNVIGIHKIMIDQIPKIFLNGYPKKKEFLMFFF